MFVYEYNLFVYVFGGLKVVIKYDYISIYYPAKKEFSRK